MMLESEKESYEAFNMRIRGEEAIREVIELKSEVERLKAQNLKLTDMCFDMGIKLAELKGLPTPYDGN